MRNRILAVDDADDILELVKISLELEGYEVKTASGGAAALQMVSEETPDLVICDIMMPDMSGFQVVKSLKADPRTENIPIIMLTARGGETDISDAIRVGVDLYLTKPFSPTELLSFVRRLIVPHSG